MSVQRGAGWVHGDISSEITLYILKNHCTKFGALIHCHNQIRKELDYKVCVCVCLSVCCVCLCVSVRVSVCVIVRSLGIILQQTL